MRVVRVRMEDVKVCGDVRVGVRMEDMCEEKVCGRMCGCGRVYSTYNPIFTHAFPSLVPRLSRLRSGGEPGNKAMPSLEPVFDCLHIYLLTVFDQPH